MRLRIGAGLLLAVLGYADIAHSKLPWEEYDKQIKTHESMAVLGSDLFGEQVNLVNGGLSFSITDINLPGNSNLPVALTRTFTVTNRFGYLANDEPLADWDLDLPRLSGVFATNWPDARCTVAQAPPSAGGGYTASEYWQGNSADMPSGGEMLVPKAGVPQPSSGGPYKWMTTGFTYFSCLGTIQNGTGEGFLAITPDGTKYWFNWMAQYTQPALDKPVSIGFPVGLPPLTRKKNVLYATRVEDRFGNWVTYTYSNTSTTPVRLSSMQANDGRAISLTYNSNGQMATASDGSHTWTYQYSYPTATTGTLIAVILPDARSWQINFKPLSDAVINYDYDAARNCDSSGRILDGGGIGSIVHPSGAIGQFEVIATTHGRSNVPKACINWESPNNDPTNDVAVWPKKYDVLSLKQKTISGPGLTAAQWNFNYTSASSWIAGSGPTCQTATCAEPVCLSDSCAGTSVTSIAGPESEWKRYTHGNSYLYAIRRALRLSAGCWAGLYRPCHRCADGSNQHAAALLRCGDWAVY